MTAAGAPATLRAPPHGRAARPAGGGIPPCPRPVFAAPPMTAWPPGHKARWRNHRRNANGPWGPPPRPAPILRRGGYGILWSFALPL